LAVIATTAVVFWRGDRELKISLGAIIAGWLLSIKAYVYGGDLQQGIFLVDTVLFGWFLWLALHSQRFWPLFAAAMAMLMVMVHITKAVFPSIDGWSYLSAGILFSYLNLAAVAVGAWATEPVGVPSPEPLREAMPPQPVPAMTSAATVARAPSSVGMSSAQVASRRRRAARPVAEPA